MTIPQIANFIINGARNLKTEEQRKNLFETAIEMIEEQRLEAVAVEPIVLRPGRDLQASDESKSEEVDTVDSKTKPFSLRWWENMYLLSTAVYEDAIEDWEEDRAARYANLSIWIVDRIRSNVKTESE